MSGSGKLTDPWDLASALSSPSIVELAEVPTKTIYLRGGTYSGDFINSLNGTAEIPITIQSYPGEWAAINGYFQVNGSYITFKNIEFCYDGWTGRESTQTGSNPNDIPSPTLNHRSPGTKFINCVIHDLRSPYIGVEAIGAEFYGCVSYHNGWAAPDRGHGHNIYMHNTNTTRMVIKDCIFFDNFGWGIHCYSGTNEELYYIDFIGNTSFCSGSLDLSRPDFLIGSEGGPSRFCTISNNMTYEGSRGLEFYGSGAELTALTDNYMPNGKDTPYTADAESGNYWGAAIGNQVFLRANDYDPNRANLTVYNQAESNTVSVDVSAIYSNGDVLTVRNVQDYFVDIQTLTITGGSITVDMQAINRTVATPVGWTAPATTFPTFGCFVLEKQ